MTGAEFTSAVRELRPPSGDSSAEYALGRACGPGFAAVSRSGQHAWVMALPDLAPGTVGRRGAGFALLSHPSIRFDQGGRSWTSPAAALVSTDADLDAAFDVLALDIAERCAGTWSSLVELVEEWQALLAPRGAPTPEAELGLWGELWFIASSRSPDLLLRAWRGPEGANFDFLLGGISAEIKTTRQPRVHHVSTTQVSAASGEQRGFLLSFAVAIDPVRGCTVPVLVDRIVGRTSSAPFALRTIARAGYRPADRDHYRTALAVMAEPEWYPNDAVPRIHGVDPGISHIRYRLTLDEDARASGDEPSMLWRHFLGHEYGVDPG